jgi:uncharacterized OB-fold protein
MIDPKDLRGTPLGEEDFKSKRILSVWDSPKLQYAWDTGAAMHRFLQELKKGRIVGRTCEGCRRVLVPPRMFCEQCFRNTDAWTFARDTGVVNTFSICHIRWDMVKLSTPEIPAVIEIDGAARGCGFMHKLGNVEPGRVKTGLRVRAVWKPPAEREGSILDILHFEPAEG